MKRRRPEIRKRIGKRVAVGRDGARDFLERLQVMEVGVLGLRVFVKGEVRLAVVADKWSAVIFSPAKWYVWFVYGRRRVRIWNMGNLPDGVCVHSGDVWRHVLLRDSQFSRPTLVATVGLIKARIS